MGSESTAGEERVRHGAAQLSSCLELLPCVGQEVVEGVQESGGEDEVSNALRGVVDCQDGQPVLVQVPVGHVQLRNV